MIPGFLKNINKEFIGIDGELYYVKVELVHFSEFPAEALYVLQKELNNDPLAEASLDILKIEDEKTRLHKFGLCRFGGFDNKADFNESENKHNPEYYDCGERGNCSVEGKLCRFVQTENGYLTPREIEFIKLIAQDLADKQIADRLGISITTANTHRRNIQHKIGCNSKVGICRFAIEKNII